ncbi:MAG: hypothetical protein AVDCRST_MAG53-75 [uncultured Solirubrobacteraceae bacterium]|uniref:Uncharacterized protein n=1 Tax=uncultured Solirubrobacteraceae bacterium TaxID=1162706 RepID=A0A6J4RL62_9ACTN|nr:MAG: hypothetical protein AVDCRST_MAG53-75 [uncultured Solirubrobacteraceae bacterium]
MSWAESGQTRMGGPPWQDAQRSPANIRNMWDEIYGWFDAFPKPPTDLDHTESQPGSTGRPGR